MKKVRKSGARIRSARTSAPVKAVKEEKKENNGAQANVSSEEELLLELKPMREEEETGVESSGAEEKRSSGIRKKRGAKRVVVKAKGKSAIKEEIGGEFQEEVEDNDGIEKPQLRRKGKSKAKSKINATTEGKVDVKAIHIKEETETKEAEAGMAKTRKRKQATVGYESGSKKPRLKGIKKEEDEAVDEKPKPSLKKVTLGMSKEQKDLTETVGKEVLKAAEGSRKLLGVHVSAAGSLEQSVYNAIALGCRSFALFVRNQRTWRITTLGDDVVERFASAIKEHAFPIENILPHGSYLINAGSPDPEKLQKSREGMLDECQRCERLGITMYNFHPGSTVGVCTREECLSTVAATINYVIERTKFITLVVETMAGQGNTVGGTFEELRQIIDQVNDKDRVGVCIDTCHIFAAGYDIREKELYEETMNKFDNIVGFKYLRAFHINDSKEGLGSKLDRHENIGKGKLGLQAFRNLMDDPRLDRIPMILETPEGIYDREMISMYNSVKKVAVNVS